jgi:phage major head subunit gpT-like protein
MIISPTNIAYFFTTLQSRFWDTYGATPAFYDKIATTIPSSSEIQGYGWIGMVDKFREWLGPRTVHSPAPETYFVTNKAFELTESIDQFKLQDDTYGIYYPMVQFMGIQARKWADYQLRDLICNTTTGAYYSSTSVGPQLSLDGIAHWSAVHPVDMWDSGKGTYVNDYGTGTSSGGVTCGGVLTPNAYATVWQDMTLRRAQSGEPLGVVPNLLTVPPQLDITAKTILHAQFFAPAVSTNIIGTGTAVGPMENMLKGSSDILMVPEFAANSAALWYLLDTTKPVKPFVWQLREAPDFVTRIQPSDPVVFDSHTYLYGSKARGSAAWSMPFLSSRSGA